ncbi:AraC family transcriptional regulator [Roseicella aquatilis]|nr:AraC family transcriptional regulator [Roseicella aquatilis]
MSLDGAHQPPRLQPVHAFSTASVEPARQFEAWQALCGAFLELTVPGDPRAGYAARCTTWKLGPLALASVTAPETRHRRTLPQIRRDAIDHWVIRLPHHGIQRIRTGTGSAEMPAGLPFVLSLARALEGERSDLAWTDLFVPRDLFPGLSTVIDRSLHRPLGSSLGLLLSQYLGALNLQLPGLTEAELPRLVTATRAMVSACIAPSPETRDAAAPLLDQARLERARNAIRQNMRSPTLTPKRLCRLVGMSRSQLYRLFEPMGGVARHIQAERLREAHRALADPDNARDIHEIAEDLGFFDASAFSRIFRREYGCKPSDVRAAALSGTGEIPLRQSPAQAPAGTLTALLRALR